MLVAATQQGRKRERFHSFWSSGATPVLVIMTFSATMNVQQDTGQITASAPKNKTLSYLPPLLPVDIEFADLTYTVHPAGYGPKTILRSVHGQFRSGQLTAILGPSGSGKSTLLNVLAGYKSTKASGSILVNGRQRDMRVFRRISRYIMQEDLLQPHLSVCEAMHAAAQLKLGTTIPQAQRSAAVDEILDLLRLLRTKNTRTEKLSGGERKRLSIALELINNPPVMFLDEPTTKEKSKGMLECASGEYDPHHVERMVAAVENGRCHRWTPRVIYQPSTSGPITNATGTTTINEENSQQNAVSLENTSSSDNNGLVFKKQQFAFALSGWEQFRVLLMRMMLQVWRDKSHLTLKFSLHLALGILIGFMFYDMGNDGSKTMFNFGFCFTCIIFFLYIPMMPVLLQFPIEVKILRREHFNRWYSLGAYYCAYTISRLPLQLLLGTIYACLVYWLSGQPMEIMRLLRFLNMCLLVSLVSESLGLTIGSTLGIVNGMFTGPVLSVPLMLLSCYGMGSGSATIPFLIRIAMSFSYLRYGLEGIIVTMYGDDRQPLACPIDYCHLREPVQLLRHVGMETVSYWEDVAFLVVNFLVLRIATFLLLRYRLSSRRSLAAVNIIGRFVKTRFHSTPSRARAAVMAS
ncbi:hypothetical protein B566_EDAN005414 [Ephemera danica]|nr:hypothetical protein B566_EDAN005414 [Ephemera danica]